MKTDSQEEGYFLWYLEELRSFGIVKEIERSPTYELYPKITAPFLDAKGKQKEQCLLRGHNYTPDFRVTWNPIEKGRFFLEMDAVYEEKPINRFFAHIAEGEYYTNFEVKPLLRGRPKLGAKSGAEAKINILAVHHVYGHYTHLVEVGRNDKSIFAKTFTPDRFLLTDKTGKPRKLHYEPRCLETYLSELAPLKTKSYL